MSMKGTDTTYQRVNRLDESVADKLSMCGLLENFMQRKLMKVNAT